MGNKVKIAGIPFLNTTMNNLLKNYIKPSLQKKEKCFIVTANPEIVMMTRRNEDYKKKVLQADHVVADGIGVIFAAKYKKQPLQERIAGFDLMTQMLKLANEEKASCYFLGASEASNSKAVERIKQLYPDLKVAGRHHGYVDIHDQSIVDDVTRTEPDFVFVALGCPKQEEWIHHNIGNCSKGIFIGVGGCIDVYAGNVKRAPDLWIKWNIEWLYRLLKQPFRFKRMFPIAKFLWLTIMKKI